MFGKGDKPIFLPSLGGPFPLVEGIYYVRKDPDVIYSVGWPHNTSSTAFHGRDSLSNYPRTTA